MKWYSYCQIAVVTISIQDLNNLIKSVSSVWSVADFSTVISTTKSIAIKKNTMTNPTIALQIQTLPDNPGVYQYYDKEGKILYVGKAKNLKKRVSSYFNKIHATAQSLVLVKKIVKIKKIKDTTKKNEKLMEINI